MHSENQTQNSKTFPFLQGTPGHRRAGIPRIGAKPASGTARQTVEAMIEALPSRVRDIAIMRGLGYKLQEIAQQMGLTPQAVSIMLERYRGRIKELGVRTEHWTLSTRAANALGRLRVSTREEARAAKVAERLRGQRNCGERTIAEIERWLAEGTDG